MERLAKGKAEVRVQGKRLHCRIEDLEAVTGERRREFSSRSPAISGPRQVVEVRGEISLRRKRVEPALDELDAYLDQALLAGREEVRIIHGHGSGAMKSAVREWLRRHRAVESFRPGERGEGGDGVTVARLKE
jgi:DNA mismatch repair protein MutS2